MHEHDEVGNVFESPFPALVRVSASGTTHFGIFLLLPNFKGTKKGVSSHGGPLVLERVNLGLLQGGTLRSFTSTTMLQVRVMIEESVATIIASFHECHPGIFPTLPEAVFVIGRTGNVFRLFAHSMNSRRIFGCIVTGKRFSTSGTLDAIIKLVSGKGTFGDENVIISRLDDGIGKRFGPFGELFLVRVQFGGGCIKRSIQTLFGVKRFLLFLPFIINFPSFTPILVRVI